jgi:zinc/manganese transport system permease protein
VYLLSLYKGFATAATNILFGQIFGVSPGQISLLTVIAISVLGAMAILYRPLLFASVDAELAEARGVPTRLVGMVFVFVLAVTVTEAAQIVGTLLVLSLAITPAAAASRLTARMPVVIAISVGFASGAARLLLSLTHRMSRPAHSLGGLNSSPRACTGPVRPGDGSRTPRSYVRRVLPSATTSR